MHSKIVVVDRAAQMQLDLVLVEVVDEKVQILTHR